MTATNTRQALRVDTWNDIVCPWCYVGEARLAKAAVAAGDDLDVQIVPHAFELDPNHAHPEKVLDMLARKYGRTEEEARAMDARVADLARAEGLPYSSERVTFNTFDAHRLVAAAAEAGVALPVLHELQRRHFSGEADLSQPAELVAAVVAGGLGEVRAREVLAGDEFAEAVRGDEEAAREIGVTGVPFALVDRRFAVPGCGSVEQYAELLRRGAAGE